MTLILVAVHLGAGLAVALSGIHVTVVATLWLAIGLSLVAGLRLHGARTARTAITALELRSAGEWNCRVFRAVDADGIACRIRTQFVTRFGAVLTIRYPDRWLAGAVVILADALSAEDFRQLRVSLRLAPPAA